jgi:2',3'-cyclic-nucleotide 2'-phosphodiesterase (5'-nucleotidase family)
MRNLFALTRLLRSISLIGIMVFGASVLLAQAPATAIEPCPATPTPKPGITTATTPVKVKTTAKQIEIDSSIADDPAVEKVIAPYAEKVKALSVVVGTVDGVLKKGTVGAGNLGQFVTDAMLSQAKERGSNNIALAIINAGGLRKNEIAAGQLRASDIFELLPFENALITIELSGAQLAKITQSLVRDSQAGARIQFRWNEQNRTEVSGAKLVDAEGREHALDNNATYTIVTIDYLYNLKSGTYALLQEGKNKRELGITLREAVMNYVKEETAAGRSIKSRTDDRYLQIGPGPTSQENPPE